jgi:cyclopropane-fatty-acyl-phospholipid synthase
MLKFKLGVKVNWAFKKLLEGTLSAGIRNGTFTLYWPDGSSSVFGDGGEPQAALELKDAATLRRMALNPALALGETYMDQGSVPVNCSMHDVLHLIMLNICRYWNDMKLVRWQAAFLRALRPILQANNARRARRNVAHHYDLNGRLYSLFLDRDRQYSCAYFPRGDETLEEAQAAKKRHIAAKLKLDRPGLSILDIGSGWGGMALTLARDYGAEVTGITLSEEQLHEARARATAEGLDDRVSFELMDYRNLNQQFDRIVSVGMFEHVGVPNYPECFRVIKRSLKPDGVALLHSIGRVEGPAATNQWFTKYIFPGGYSPALSEVLGPIERSGLITTDIEILRLHYARTLAHWRFRFAANRDAISALYDERFCRMFEFYLSGSELSFSIGDHMNFQIQLTRDLNTLPITRDYMTESERRTAFASSGD